MNVHGEERRIPYCPEKIHSICKMATFKASHCLPQLALNGLLHPKEVRKVHRHLSRMTVQ